MKTKLQHTPLPWIYDETFAANAIVTNTPQRSTIARTAKMADAAFIVRAVNSHEEMIQTLKHIQDLAEENTHSPQDAFCQVAEWARNQIAQAEGK